MLALAAVLVTFPALGRPTSWNWRSAGAARSIAWPDIASRPALELDPSLPLPISERSLVLVPIEAGDHLSIAGDGVFVGLASGSGGPYPDAITWQPGPTRGTLRIPASSSARFLALRANQPTQVSVWVAAKAERPLTAHRLDESVYAFLTHAEAALPVGESADDQRALLALKGLDSLLSRALVVRPGQADVQAPDPRARYLHTHWLNWRLLRRSLLRPFYLRQAALAIGGQAIKESTDTDETAEQWRFLRAPDILTVPPQSADIVSLDVRARALGRTRVQVFSGDLLVHDSVFRIPRRAEDPLRWTPPRNLRVLPSTVGAVRLVVLEGSVRVRTSLRNARYGMFENAAAHRPSLLAVRAPAWSDAPAWFTALVELVTVGGIEPLGRVREYLKSHPEAPETALLIYAALPAMTAYEAPESHLASFWASTASLPEGQRDALRISLLERLARALPEAIETEGGPEAISGPKVGVESPPDAVVASALLESVVSASDRERPVESPRLEQIAAARADQGRFVDLAALAWSRSAPFAALRGEGAPQRLIHRRPFDANQPDGLCNNYGPRGLRWWLVPAETQTFDVEDLGGTHTSVQLRPLHAETTVGAEVRIGQTPVFVHPALGKASRVGLRPGRHTIEHVRGGSVLARIPRQGTTPCQQLRETERWTVVDGAAVFSLPGGASPTVASVIVDPSSLEGGVASLWIELGGETHAAWVRRPATGSIEVVVPGGASQMTIRSDRLLLVRARVRLHPGPPRQLPQRSSTLHLAEADNLVELSSLTRQLRSADDRAASRALRSRRAETLHAIGYRSLADLDFRRAGRPDAGQLRSVPGALFLPQHSDAVLPLGLEASAPLLPSVSAPAELARALALNRLGRGPRALELLLEQGADQPDDVGSLVVATLASELGRSEIAAPIFERLARATDNGALYYAAAEQYDALAVATQRLEPARQAFVLAALAANRGLDVGKLTSRYREAVEWHAPSLTSVGSGTVSIERRGEDPSTWTLGERVRRALMLAPDEANVFGGDTRLAVRRFGGQDLQLTTLCFDREGEREGCDAAVTLDNAPVDCSNNASGEMQVARPQTCRVVVPDGGRELVIRLPPNAMGWVLLQRLETENGTSVMRGVPWQKRYVKLTPDEPMTVHVGGPGVVRVSARGEALTPATLTVVDSPLSLPGEAASRTIPLPVGSDSGASWVEATGVGATTGEGVAVSPELTLDQVVATAGPHALELRVSGAVLARPEVAHIIAPPLLPSDPLEAPEVVASTSDVVALLSPLTPVGAALAFGPISLSSSVTLSDRDVSEADRDAADRFIEPALSVRKGLSEQALWLEGTALARVRDGAASLGVLAAASLSPRGLVPGAFASARVVTQPSLRATGARATLGLRHRVEVSDDLSLLPEAAFTFRLNAAAAEDRPGADRDVYSAYAENRPRSLDVGAALLQRPFVDTIGRHSVTVRTNPTLLGVDRIDLSSRFDVLAGRGSVPWVRLGLSGSYRPASYLRRQAFTRWQLSPAATFWHWVDHASRFWTQLSLSVFVDTPNPSGSGTGLFASLSVTHDFMLGSGLSDYRISERPFPDRLEEGGPAAVPGVPSIDTYWQEGSDP